jgi:uncharacterized protein (DUF2235 family)
MAAYEWLSDNYQDGDRIFLFGGTFQFHLLDGFLKFGL